VTVADADQASAAVLNICAADLGGCNVPMPSKPAPKDLKIGGLLDVRPAQRCQRAIIFLRIAAGLEDPKRGRRAAMAEPHTVMGP
jgi:hypothetical protein